MYEYKVEVYRVNEAEEEMNALAREGWRVVAVTSNECILWTAKDTIVVTYERSKQIIGGICYEIWIQNANGQLLMTQRHPNKKAGGLWEFIGGEVLLLFTNILLVIYFLCYTYLLQK